MPAALSPSLVQAARLVARVAAGQSLAAQSLLTSRSTGLESRAAVLDLVNGTLRKFGWVRRVVEALAHRGSPDALVSALLWCALYALDSGRYGAHTVVDETVRACGALERWSAKGFVNALLRSYVRKGPELRDRLASDAEAHYQHPAWWIDIVRSGYPDSWQRVLAAGNEHPPMCLRVNRRRSATEEYESRLREAGMSARRVGDAALILERPVPVERLPGFAAGDVSIQDAGAQRAAPLMSLFPGAAVLDACAAPGGKAAHMLELEDIRLTALEPEATRLLRLKQGLERLQLAATVKQADCMRLDDWWDGARFDRILADVPCTSSGVARRHPDVKWLRRAEDTSRFASQQAEMLDALWQVLAPGGKLLYVTCSVFPGENEEVVAAFVLRTRGSRCVPLPDDIPSPLLPGPEHDGFFYALLEKEV